MRPLFWILPYTDERDFNSFTPMVNGKTMTDIFDEILKQGFDKIEAKDPFVDRLKEIEQKEFDKYKHNFKLKRYDTRKKRS
jgi:hypothetical protein